MKVPQTELILVSFYFTSQEIRLGDSQRVIRTGHTELCIPYPQKIKKCLRQIF